MGYLTKKKKRNFRFMAETRNDTYPLAQRVSEEDLLWKKGEDNYPRRTYLPRDDTPLELVGIMPNCSFNF